MREERESWDKDKEMLCFIEKCSVSGWNGEGMLVVEMNTVYKINVHLVCETFDLCRGQVH